MTGTEIMDSQELVTPRSPEVQIGDPALRCVMRQLDVLASLTTKAQPLAKALEPVSSKRGQKHHLARF